MEKLTSARRFFSFRKGYTYTMTDQRFYLTTAIPYVNAAPHIGHALEYVIADAIHRYHEIIGNKV